MVKTISLAGTVNGCSTSSQFIFILTHIIMLSFIFAVSSIHLICWIIYLFLSWPWGIIILNFYNWKIYNWVYDIVWCLNLCWQITKAVCWRIENIFLHLQICWHVQLHLLQQKYFINYFTEIFEAFRWIRKLNWWICTFYSA